MSEPKLLKMKVDFTTKGGIELKKNGIFHIINPLRDDLIESGKAEAFNPKGVMTTKQVKKLTNKSQ